MKPKTKIREKGT